MISLGNGGLLVFWLLENILDRFDFAAMETFGGAEMTKRFKEALVTGEKTSESDERILEKALFEWCASKGCINYAHW